MNRFLLPLALVACSGAATPTVADDDGDTSAPGDSSQASVDASTTSATTTADASSADASVIGDAATTSSTSDASSSQDAGARQDAGSTSAAGALPYMVGIKSNGHLTAPGTVEGWLDRKMDVAGTTIDTNGYLGGAYTNSDGSHPLLEVSFPLLSIFGESTHLDDMGQAASGAYDTAYAAMAKQLAAFANPLLSARIGWELNGNWYQWSNGVTANATYATYVSAFQHAAIQLRKYNPHVLIQWNIAWGQPDPTPYWPGTYDATTNPGGVDVVSIDFYQANISQYNNGGKQSSWAMAQSGTTISLDWMVAFAQKNKVKIALSEYGAGTSTSNGLGSGEGLDDGTWTAASIAWINAQPAGFFLWTDWSDDEPADDIVTAGANPAEQAAWSAAWKGTHFGGTWWTGTAPPSATP